MVATKANRLPRPSKAAEEIDHGQRRSVVVRQLLGDIFSGSLRAGQRLIIQQLARRLKMSPTPIREGLIQLASMGIIDFIPNCGGVVREMTSSDVREICQVRRALECEATRSACGRIDLPQLHALAHALRRIATTKRIGAGAVEKARRLDSQLHDLIAQSCGNRFLASELERLKILFRAFRDAAWDDRLAGHDYYRVSEEAEEHLAIVDALLERDPRGAARAMSRHIRASVKYWNRSLPPVNDYAGRKETPCVVP